MSADDLYHVADAIQNLISDSAKTSLLHTAVFVIKHHVNANAPWDNVKRATSHQIIDSTAAYIANDHHAAVWLDEGTEPHEIKAKNAKALRFEIGGQVLFRRRVNHLGTKPTHFWTNGVESGVREVDQLLVAFGDRVLVEVF